MERRPIYQTNLDVAPEDGDGGLKRVTLEFFNENNGYTPLERNEVRAMRAGELRLFFGRGIKHAVRRVA